MLEQGVTAAAFAVHTFLVDVLLIGETPLGDLLPMFKRVEPYDEASEMGQTLGDMAALAWGLTEAVIGLGVGLGAVGVEGGLMVVPGGQLIAVPGLPVAAGAALAGAGLLVHGGLTAVVAGSHLMEPRQYMNKNQGSQGGPAPPKPSSATPKSGLSVVERPGMQRRTVTDRHGREVTIWGQAEQASSKTPGHAEAINKQVARMAASGDYEYITVQRSWRTATGRVSPSRDMPDVIGVRRDGHVDAYEVWSKTDDKTELWQRLNRGMGTLPPGQRGNVGVIPPAPVGNP